MHRIIAISIGLLSTILLASCGGDDSTRTQSADGSIKRIQAISGSASILATSTGGAPITNTTGSIPYNSKYTIPTDPTLPADKQTGLISNQYWVFGTQKAELDLILTKYKNLSIVAWREDFGYVIEVNQDDRLSIADLNALQGELGIDRVYRRSYAGPNAKLDYSRQQ